MRASMAPSLTSLFISPPIDMRLTNSLPDLHSRRRNQPPETDASQLQHQQLQSSLFHSSSFSSDDFFDQILCTVPPPWELPPGLPNPHSDLPPQPLQPANPDNVAFQIGDTTPAAKMAMALLQQQLLMSRGIGTTSTDEDSSLLPMPGNDVVEIKGSSSFKCPNPIDHGSIMPSLFNEFTGFLNASGSGHNQNQSQGNSKSQKQNFGAPVSVSTPPPAGPSSGSGGSAPAQPRQRVRARRGQATDPHSIAERLRRERIAERMKALQELVPNANKTDKASMLDEIIDYVKFLQLQVKVLSVSRLGGATAAMPSLRPDPSTEGGTECNQSNGTGGAVGQTSTGAPSSNDTMTVTEHQVVKLMEEDMGSAMQYLQGKGLCLMPISLATAISSATCRGRPITASKGGGDAPTSPSLSALTVQSTALGHDAVRDSTSVFRP